MDVFSDFVYNNMSGFSWSGRNIGLALLHAVPGDVASNAPPSVDNLVGATGFQELAAPGYARVVTNANSVVTSFTSVVVGADYNLTQTADAYVAAGVFYIDATVGGIVKPWLFITTVCFGNVVTPGSRVSALPAPTAKILFNYGIQGSTVIPTLGNIVQAPGPQEWEPSRMYHVYLYPERVNWIPNPSFEDVAMFGWRANGAITRLSGGVDLAANHYLHVAGTRLECIPSGSPNGNHRLSAYVRSTGATWVQLGLICYQDDFITFAEKLGQRRIISNSWGYMDSLVPSLDDTAGTSFLVLSDGPFDIDLALMESVADRNAYFDGASTTGAVGDFSWQGVPHESYSFWYNNRYLAGARLFGQYVEGQVLKKGLVYDWIPFDSALATHWDVLSPTDTRHAMKDWASRTIP